METAGKEIEDDTMRQAMKDCGIGTPATRAAIIETLLKRGYMVRQQETCADGKRTRPAFRGEEHGDCQCGDDGQMGGGTCQDRTR